LHRIASDIVVVDERLGCRVKKYPNLRAEGDVRPYDGALRAEITDHDP
jgi:hypothetical protein